MTNLNSILIEGNLTKDPELSYTEKGTAVCQFSVACRRTWKEDKNMRKEVFIFDVSVYARQAEMCAKYLKKGRGVLVVGRLAKADENVFIIAEQVELKP